MAASTEERPTGASQTDPIQPCQERAQGEDEEERQQQQQQHQSEQAPSRPPSAPPFAISPAAAAYNMPIASYLAAHPRVSTLVAAAAVLDRGSGSSSSSGARVLLLRRAAGDFRPLQWEVPGGTAEPGRDGSVLAAAARELREETGLRAAEVGRLVAAVEFGDDADGRVWRKLTFEVRVELDGAGEVVLDPAEHCAFVWASEEEVRAGRCGDVELLFTFENQRAEVLAAFEAGEGGGGMV